MLESHALAVSAASATTDAGDEVAAGTEGSRIAAQAICNCQPVCTVHVADSASDPASVKTHLLGEITLIYVVKC